MQHPVHLISGVPNGVLEVTLYGLRCGSRGAIGTIMMVDLSKQDEVEWPEWTILCVLHLDLFSAHLDHFSPTLVQMLVFLVFLQM